MARYRQQLTYKNSTAALTPMHSRVRMLFAQFTIRDILWLTVVAAVVLSLWLGWWRETAAMRADSAAREAKLRDQVVAERDLWKTKTRDLMKAYSESMVKSKTQEAMANKLQEIASDRKSEISRLEDEVRRLKAKKSTTLLDP